MLRKLTFVFVIAAIANFQVFGQENRKVDEKGWLSSLSNLQAQVRLLLSNINILLGNGTITNALTQITIAGTNITQIQNASNEAVNKATEALNGTFEAIYDRIASLQKNASDQGVDTSNCTKTLSADVANFTTGYASGLADCPINLAAKGVAMVNSDVEYINYINGLAVALPKNITACGWTNVTCLMPLVSTYGITIAQAAIRITTSVAALSTYVSTLQTQIGICLTNTSVFTVAAVTKWGANITLCIGKEMRDNAKNQN